MIQQTPPICQYLAGTVCVMRSPLVVLSFQVRSQSQVECTIHIGKDGQALLVIFLANHALRMVCVIQRQANVRAKMAGLDIDA
jgi:hypothetical protein